MPTLEYGKKKTLKTVQDGRPVMNALTAVEAMFWPGMPATLQPSKQPSCHILSAALVSACALVQSVASISNSRHVAPTCRTFSTVCVH